jgi:signal transduction histidine kinase
MSIRVRVTSLMLVFSLGLVLVSAAALYWSERKALREEAKTSRKKMADQFARSCREALLVGDELAALNAAGFLGKVPGVLQAFAVGVSGRVVAHTAQGRLGKPPAKDPANNDRWRIKKPLGLSRQGQQGAGFAIVDFSRSAMEEEIATALRPAAQRILWVMSGGLFFSLLGAGFLAGTITRPILRIARGTRAIAEGHLDHVIEPLGRDELGVLARDFNHMASRLGEVERMKNTFVANVTHELRSPLSAIESCAGLIADEVRAGDLVDVTDQLAAVRNNAIRLGRFVNDLLDLSRIDAGMVGVDPERLSARESVDEVVALFQAKAAEKSIALCVGDIPKDLLVWADPDKLCQILTNLVGNALKFTPRRGRVTVDALAEAGGTTLSVQDTGPGIGVEDQKRIFDRFEQVREARDHVEGTKGTGLGLSIARGLVEAHGGRLLVHSVLGQGSTFVVWLPLEV